VTGGHAGRVTLPRRRGGRVSAAANDVGDEELE